MSCSREILAMAVAGAVGCGESTFLPFNHAALGPVNHLSTNTPGACLAASAVACGSRLNRLLLQFREDIRGQTGAADVLGELFDRRKAIIGDLLLADTQVGR